MPDGVRNDLFMNLKKLHTTELGVERIKRNLGLTSEDAVAWCRHVIENPSATVSRRGKNWYIIKDGCEITVNASSYTIITAHKLKNGEKPPKGVQE